MKVALTICEGGYRENGLLVGAMGHLVDGGDLVILVANGGERERNGVCPIRLEEVRVGRPRSDDPDLVAAGGKRREVAGVAWVTRAGGVSAGGVSFW